MKAEFLSMGTDLYEVKTDEIIVYKAECIKRGDSGLYVRARYTDYYAELNDNVLNSECSKLYLDFSDAQKRQLEKRKKVIDEAYDAMCKAKEYYEKIILKYKDKPATSINEVKR